MPFLGWWVGPDPFLPYSLTLSLPTQACRLLVSPRDPPPGYKIPVQNPCKNPWPGQGMIPWPGQGIIAQRAHRRGPHGDPAPGFLWRAPDLHCVELDAVGTDLGWYQGLSGVSSEIRGPGADLGRGGAAPTVASLPRPVVGRAWH